jgi:hypothetical protein
MDNRFVVIRTAVDSPLDFYKFEPFAVFDTTKGTVHGAENRIEADRLAAELNDTDNGYAADVDSGEWPFAGHPATDAERVLLAAALEEAGS